MEMLTSTTCFPLFGIIICLLLYLKLQSRFKYWCYRKVTQIKPTLVIGNITDLITMRKSSAEFIRELYNHPEAKNKPFIGIYIFHKPALLIRDPELIKRLLIRDFNKFSNRSYDYSTSYVTYNRYSNSEGNQDPLGSRNLFFLKNPNWKEIRLKLTPFFTAMRLKHMFKLIEEIGRTLDHLLQMNDRLDNFNMKELCAWYTTDVIASVAYGVDANTLKDPNASDFRRHGRAIFEFTFWRAIHLMVAFFLPQFVPYLRIQVVPAAQTQFLRSAVNHIVHERESSGTFRNDLIDMLIEFKQSTKNHDYCNNKISNKDPKAFVFEGDIMVAQAAIFFTAGFEPSSSTMSFAIYELAKNSVVQCRLRQEIKRALIKSNGSVTQEVIESLEYMQMVISEVLRLYPPLPFLDRECTADNEEYSLEPFGDYVIPRGMPVYIPVYGLHMDSTFFEEPERFEPERFSAENRKHIPPYTYMPFGLGQRACIGERFAMIQIKIGLLYFLRNHYIEPNAKTPIHIKFDTKALIVQSADEISVNIVKDPIFPQT